MMSDFDEDVLADVDSDEDEDEDDLFKIARKQPFVIDY